MPALSRPSSRPSSSSSLLRGSGIERELNVAATNAEKNRCIQVNESPSRKSLRLPRAMSAPPSASEFRPDKNERTTQKGIVENSKTMKKSISFTLVDQDCNPDSRQDGGGLSLGVVEHLIGNLANTIKFSIFPQEESRPSLALETREHNGSQLVLM